MRNGVALLGVWLALVVAAGSLPAPAAAQSSGAPIVLAQNDTSLGGFFRRLFRHDQPSYQPPPDQGPQREQTRRRGSSSTDTAAPRRRARAAPTPREVKAVEKADDAKRVLAIGDFMAGAVAKGLADTYEENPNVVVIDASSGSSGLVRDDYYDWPGKLPALVEDQKPDAIVVLIGANDRQTIATDSGKYAPGSDGWRAAYATRVAALADALKATGKPALWLGLPPVSSSSMSRDYSVFNGIVREQLEARGLKLIETWNGFANEDGKYVAVGPDVSGQSVQLRNSDGLNFTRAGQRKLAYYVEQALNEALGSPGQFLANANPTAPTALPGEEAAKIGPMVPLDALASAGGDTLSGATPLASPSGSPEAGQAEASPDTGAATPSEASTEAAAGTEGKGSTEGESGTEDVAVSIAERLAGKDAATPPPGRADSFLWPPPPPKVTPAAALATAETTPLAPALAPPAEAVPTAR